MEQKLFGMGIGKAISLCIFFWMLTVFAKVAFTKYPVKGVSEFISAV